MVDAWDEVVFGVVDWPEYMVMVGGVFPGIDRRGPTISIT